MNILVVAGTNLKFIPYLSLYLDIFLKVKCEVTLFYWDRNGNPDITLANEIKTACFKKIMRDDASKWIKLKNFLSFRRAAKRLLNKKKFDLIVVLTTQFAMLLSDILIFEYRKRYIFDYRDPSYERFSLYSKLLAKLIKESKVTMISSEGYRSILAKSENICLNHNIDLRLMEFRDVRKSLPRQSSPLRISFWGFIRDSAINLSLIEALANDPRFEIYYFGKRESVALKIEEHCKKNRISNVFLSGEYLPDDRLKFVEDTDMMHNVYTTSLATGNKFYDALVFYLPQICTKGTFMGDEIEKHGLGMLFEPGDETFGDKLFDYYLNLDWNDFHRRCDAYLSLVLEQQEMARKTLLDAIHPPL